MPDEFKMKKLEELRKLGVDPYPYSYGRNNYAEEVKEKFGMMEGKEASIAGRAIRLRNMGKLFFIDLLDETGIIQVLAKPDSTDELSMKILKLSDMGDILGVSGKVVKTQRGEKSIEAKRVTMLSKSVLSFPEKFHGLTDIEARYRKRYLDLIMNPDVRRTFRARTQIVNVIREYLNKRGFMEVETPVLQPVYGGANAKPFVTHHNYLKSDFYLRIANELYLKRLVIGGFGKVYEFSKDFRNEDVDSTHNPEFTQVEIYEAYSDYEKFARMTEEIFRDISQSLYKSNKILYKEKEIHFDSFKKIYLVEEIKKRAGYEVAELTDNEALKIAEKEKLAVQAKNAYHVVDALFDKYIKDDLDQPTLVMDFPAFMCPLVKDKRGNPKLSERFEVFVAGLEVANCYSELTDPIEQRRKFEEQNAERRKGDEEMPPPDEDFLEAMEYGMPPTAGIGISIDRLAMIFTNNISIKETILFPSVRPEAAHAEKGKK